MLFHLSPTVMTLNTTRQVRNKALSSRRRYVVPLVGVPSLTVL